MNENPFAELPDDLAGELSDQFANPQSGLDALRLPNRETGGRFSIENLDKIPVAPERSPRPEEEPGPGMRDPRDPFDSFKPRPGQLGRAGFGPTREVLVPWQEVRDIPKENNLKTFYYPSEWQEQPATLDLGGELGELQLIVQAHPDLIAAYIPTVQVEVLPYATSLQEALMAKINDLHTQSATLRQELANVTADLQEGTHGSIMNVESDIELLEQHHANLATATRHKNDGKAITLTDADLNMLIRSSRSVTTTETFMLLIKATIEVTIEDPTPATEAPIPSIFGTHQNQLIAGGSRNHLFSNVAAPVVSVVSQPPGITWRGPTETREPIDRWCLTVSSTKSCKYSLVIG